MLLFDFLAEPVPQGLRFRMAVRPEPDVRLGPAVVIAAQGRHQAIVIGNAAVKSTRPFVVIAAIGFDAIEARSDELFRQRPVLLHIGTGMGQDGDTAVVVDDGDGFGKIHEGHGHESRASLAADIPAKVAELEEIGVDVIAVHTGADAQAVGREPINDLKVMKECSKKAAIAVAGGISSKTIEKYVALNPEIVIVGSAIGNAEDPVAEAKAIKEALV